MKKKKTMRKGTLFKLGSLQHWYHLHLRTHENAVFVGKG